MFNERGNYTDDNSLLFLVWVVRTETRAEIKMHLDFSSCQKPNIMSGKDMTTVRTIDNMKLLKNFKLTIIYFFYSTEGNNDRL
jgi:hypothetical protein